MSRVERRSSKWGCPIDVKRVGLFLLLLSLSSAWEPGSCWPSPMQGEECAVFGCHLPDFAAASGYFLLSLCFGGHHTASRVASQALRRRNEEFFSRTPRAASLAGGLVLHYTNLLWACGHWPLHRRGLVGALCIAGTKRTLSLLVYGSAHDAHLVLWASGSNRGTNQLGSSVPPIKDAPHSFLFHSLLHPQLSSTHTHTRHTEEP